MLSIIIPTFDEEDCLPKLLESIKNQKFNDYEIIVADFNSRDKTIQIANKYDCLVVAGGTPAQGRNNGAKSANGDLLLFLDADVILSDDFFITALNVFNKRNLKAASFFLYPQKRNWFFAFFLSSFYNFPILFMENILAHGAMAILVEKNLFEELNGFDKSIKLAEDHDLVRRAAKKAKYGIIRGVKVFISDRRFRKDGWLKTYFKYFLCELHMIFLGPVRSDIFHYKFSHYSREKNNKV